MSASQAAHGGRRVYLDSPYATLANGLIVPSGSVPVQGAVPLLLNAAGTLDMQHGNLEGTLLPSAPRSASTTVTGPPNRNAQGVTLYLNVTANPGGAETLNLAILPVDPASGANGPALASIVTTAAANGMYVIQMRPGVLSTNFAAGTSGISRPFGLPLTWKALVAHSGAGSWTYSLGYALHL